MSNQIELKPAVQPSTAPQNPETPIEPVVVDTEYSGYANGSENGGIYFELSWDTGQAQYRRQQLLTNYAGGGAGENTGYDPEYNSGGNSPASGYYGFGENSYSPRANGYGDGYYQNHNGNQYGYEGNSTFPEYYTTQPNENGSLFSTENNSPLSLNDLIDLLRDHPDFNDFRNQSKDFWRDVRQFSETTLFQNDDSNPTESPSTYKELLKEFKTKEIPLDEFVENLPPKEREVFKARFQIDQTFGENIFEADGVTLNEIGQLRVREATLESGQFKGLPVNIQFESPEKNVFAGEKGEIVFVKNENGEIVPTRRDAAIDAEKAILFGENIPANRLVSEKTESSELKFQDKSNQIAVGNNGGSLLTDNGTTRVLNHAASIDNSSSISSIARRDGGVALGGALISGSFTSIENFKNAENKGVGNSGSTTNANANGNNNFAAGATGAMMSAAIGSLVPSSDAVISGVVGFISGVVIGVEADQGLRWLSGDRPTAIASSASVNLLEENSFAPPLQTVLA